MPAITTAKRQWHYSGPEVLLDLRRSETRGWWWWNAGGEKGPWRLRHETITTKCSRTSTWRFEISSSSWSRSQISATPAPARSPWVMGSRWPDVHAGLHDRDASDDAAVLDAESSRDSVLSSWTGSRSPASSEPSTGKSGCCWDNELFNIVNTQS